MRRRWVRPAAIGIAGAAMMTLGTLDLVQHYRVDPVAAYALSAVRAVPILGRGDWASVALCGVGVVLGDTVHGRRRVSGQLDEQRRLSAAERVRRSMVEERARIARELHDVVAEFAGIAELARGSLTELRGLLSALRDERDAPELAPQPTLADLAELVERITAAGTPVRLAVDGDLAGLPNVVQLSAYRIVQATPHLVTYP